jgi:hypothetical protein
MDRPQNLPTRRKQRRAAGALRGATLRDLADSHNVGRGTISRLRYKQCVAAVLEGRVEVMGDFCSE